MTRAEIRYGLARLPAGKRRTGLNSRADALFTETDERLLIFDAKAADRWQLVAARQTTGGQSLCRCNHRQHCLGSSRLFGYQKHPRLRRLRYPRRESVRPLDLPIETSALTGCFPATAATGTGTAAAVTAVTTCCRLSCHRRSRCQCLAASPHSVPGRAWCLWTPTLITLTGMCGSASSRVDSDPGHRQEKRVPRRLGPAKTGVGGTCPSPSRGACGSRLASLGSP